ncbi:MAG TPA: hypothetical protein VNG90_03035 [Candidatus Acidoferrum sp.]|nr:hypothetical protein [Candidatus Acidoferrum sp.]
MNPQEFYAAVTQKGLPGGQHIQNFATLLMTQKPPATLLEHLAEALVYISEEQVAEYFEQVGQAAARLLTGEPYCLALQHAHCSQRWVYETLVKKGAIPPAQITVVRGSRVDETVFQDIDMPIVVFDDWSFSWGVLSETLDDIDPKQRALVFLFVATRIARQLAAQQQNISLFVARQEFVPLLKEVCSEEEMQFIDRLRLKALGKYEPSGTTVLCSACFGMPDNVVGIFHGLGTINGHPIPQLISPVAKPYRSDHRA